MYEKPPADVSINFFSTIGGERFEGYYEEVNGHIYFNVSMFPEGTERVISICDGDRVLPDVKALEQLAFKYFNEGFIETTDALKAFVACGTYRTGFLGLQTKQNYAVEIVLVKDCL